MAGETTTTIEEVKVTETKPEAKVEAKATEDATGSKEEKSSEANGGKAKPIFNQDDFERELGVRLEREKNKQAKEAERIKREAEAEAQKKNGEFKALAETLEKERDELREEVRTLAPIRAQAEEDRAALEEFLVAQREGLEAHHLELLDALSPAVQLKWIAKNRAALTKPDAPKEEKTNGAVTGPRRIATNTAGENTAALPPPPRRLFKL